MKHVRENTKMGLLGENQFPPMVNSHLSTKRHYALSQCFGAIAQSKKFFTLLTKDEKAILDSASALAEKIIILETKTSNPLDWNKDLIAGTKRVIDSSDWVMIAHNQNEENEAFADLCLQFEGDPTPVLEVGFGQEE